MVLTYQTGDLFTSDAQTLVNPVNTVGVMGKGLALEFKRRYPAMFLQYQNACRQGDFRVGDLMLWKAARPYPWVLLFPTKTDWRRPSELSYIEAGLKAFEASWRARGITSAAFPRLGCGCGELTWAQVRPIMERYLEPLPIQVTVYTLN